MLLRRIVPAAIGLAFCVSAVAETVDYRLPPEIQPTAQSIHLTLDPAKEDFTGSTVLQIDIAEDVDSIGIYQIDVAMHSITLRSGSGERTLTAEVADYDINWLSDGKVIAAGQYELSIEFSARYSTDALGLHRTHFEGNDYLFTQMEAMYLRRAVPSFDEPSFKISYTLTIEAPDGLTVVANTPVAAESRMDGWQRVEFMPTKTMSSYLVALAVGPLDRAPIDGLSVPGYVYVPKGHADSLGFVIENTPKIFDALEDYFGTSYPFRKLDFVGVPEFAFGAMENVGLATYRLEYLTLGDDATGSTASWTLGTIAHEIGHMWFGNLVTMEWWNDLWLNEAFASWIDEVILESLYPEFESHLELPQATAFGIDQGASVKPIRKEVKTDSDVTEGLYLPYYKGLTLLMMLENYVGPDKWQEGVRSYLDKFAWRNAKEPDLWQAISESSGIDVSDIARSFLNQPGFPILTVDTNGAVSQSRYLRYGAEAPDLLWTIPINVKYKKDGKIREVFYLLDHKEGEIDLPSGADWILPDAGAEGYYRWEIDINQFHALVDDIGSLDDKEKMALLDNSLALLEARRLSLEDYMLVLTKLLDESHPLVLLRAVNATISIGTDYVTDDNAVAFARFVNASLADRFAEIGLETREDDSETMIRLRPRLVRLLGQYGANPEFVAAVAEKAELYLESPQAVDDSLARELLRVIALNDKDGSFYDQYIQAYLKSDDLRQRITILQSVYFKDPEVIEKALNFSISDEVLAGHAEYVPIYFARTLDDHTILYKWLDENVDTYQAKIPANSRQELPASLTGRCNERNLKMMQDFFADRDQIYQASLSRQVERLRACIDTRNYNRAALLDFLAQYDE
ncbi:MAG: M1 family metallopeptidase [Woeseiaceae bacterium]